MIVPGTSQHLWELTYRAMVNQRYYAWLRDFWMRVDRILRVVMLLLAVFGGVVALLGLVTESKLSMTSVAIGVIALAITVVLLELPIDKSTRHNQEFYEKWNTFLGDCEKLRIKMHDKEEGPSAVQVIRLQEAMTEIEGAEQLRKDWLLRFCQRQINASTYNVPNGTHEEVLESIQVHEGNVASPGN